MLDLNTLNGARKFNYDGKVEEYIKLEKLEHVGIVRALFINEGKYGESATAIVSYIDNDKVVTIGVNLPKHQVVNVKKILDDEDTINMINEYRVSIEKVCYHSKDYDKDCYTVNWQVTSKETYEKFINAEINF